MSARKSNGDFDPSKILDASEVEFVKRGGHGGRIGQFSPLLPYLSRMKPGKALLATGAISDAPSRRTKQTQLCAWIRKRLETGDIPENFVIRVRSNTKGQLVLERTA